MFLKNVKLRCGVWLNNGMAINTKVWTNAANTESGKFVEIVNDSQFPPTSATTDPAFGPVRTIEYPKYAVLTYDVGTSGINGTPFGDNASVDAFGKLRVTQPKTLFDAKQLTDKLPAVFDEVVSGVGASSTWISGDSLTRMRTSNSGEYVIRQTSNHFNYQPGKSLLAYFTGVFTPQANIIKRIGLFQGLSSAPYTPTDGIFIESTDGVGGTVSFKVIKTAGTPYSLSAARANWNLDRLDGTGPSGLTIDLNYAQLLIIDYEWLSVGRIRFGFNVAGRSVYAHQFTNLNTLSAPYMTSGNQPVRYEIRQTGAGSGVLNHICSSVISEGGEEYIGTSLTCHTSTAVATNGTVSFRPILAARLNPTAHDLALILKDINILNTGNGSVLWEVILNPTITGGSLTFTNLDNSNVQFANGSVTLSLSGGYKLFSGFAKEGNASTANGTAAATLVGELASLGTRINGTPDIIVLAARAVKTNEGEIFASMNLILRA